MSHSHAIAIVPRKARVINLSGGLKALARLSRANSSEKNKSIFIVEGVRVVAWQQCKQSVNDVRQREGLGLFKGHTAGGTLSSQSLS